MTSEEPGVRGTPTVLQLQTKVAQLRLHALEAGATYLGYRFPRDQMFRFEMGWRIDSRLRVYAA